jgi:hypothetical protein
MVFMTPIGFGLSRLRSIVAAVALIVLTSSCSGDEPRNGEIEQRGESQQTTETHAAGAQEEQSGAIPPSGAGEAEKKPLALLWDAL